MRRCNLISWQLTRLHQVCSVLCHWCLHGCFHCKVLTLHVGTWKGSELSEQRYITKFYLVRRNIKFLWVFPTGMGILNLRLNEDFWAFATSYKLILLLFALLHWFHFQNAWGEDKIITQIATLTVFKQYWSCIDWGLSSFRLWSSTRGLFVL